MKGWFYLHLYGYKNTFGQAKKLYLSGCDMDIDFFLSYWIVHHGLGQKTHWMKTLDVAGEESVVLTFS